MQRRKIGLAVGAVAMSLALSACVAGGSGGGSSSGSTPGGQTGNITIGIKYDQPGLGMQVGNQYQGFDVDVARYVAKELGYADNQITFMETPSAQRETLIQSGQVKLIFATYSITDARKEKVDFAGPYFVAGQDILVKSDRTDINGPADLKGHKLCSVVGSTSAKKIKDQYPEVQLQEVDTYSKCAEAVAAGSMDAMTTDDIILAGYAAQPQYKGKLKVVGHPFTQERYGVGLKKGDTELQTKVNDALKKMIADGSWQKFLDNNFGASGYQYNKDTNPPTPGTA
ncbi:amino acid ABC transporter substrate-binding protein, PAAT family [Raineyella antarctica]|uniref:Amino acid ABC transporter substrate-binding protein, PAAT family n=1 Tax=Raineyella antarctica TaxID=1577474 RepID=A0A1G6GQQ2_9ACTN|nr:glutamate ABC transporter substrate-binding protein [Raineyella antarctica]SDB84330.1 amino acid ABC transporter substrate-binding protein, PAAT family [Raineyella antarctica]